MRYNIFLLFVALMVISCYNALGLGITGGDTNHYAGIFVPDSEYPFSYVGVMNGPAVNTYTLYAKKDLAEYVVFDQARFENMPPDSNVPITGKIKLPSELSPGYHHAYICIQENCPEGGGICGMAAACAAVYFMSLYPGIMPVISLSAGNVNENQPVDFIVNIENFGKDEIKSAGGTVSVYNIDKAVVGNAVLETKSIPSAVKDSLKARFDTFGLKPGDYFATAFVDADGTKKEANASFRIGTLNVKINDYTEEIETGGIKRFVINVESGWNDPLDMYATVQITGENGSASAKTTNNRLNPWSRLDLEAFIDTSKLAAGEYNIRIEAFYAEKSTVAEGKIMLVAPKEVKVELPVEKEKAGISTTALTIILVIVVVILTLVNVFLAIYRKKKE